MHKIAPKINGSASVLGTFRAFKLISSLRLSMLFLTLTRSPDVYYSFAIGVCVHVRVYGYFAAYI